MLRRKLFSKYLILILLIFIILKSCLGWPMEKVIQVIRYFGFTLIPELFILFFIISLSFLIGNKLLSVFRLNWNSFLEESLISLGLGFGIIAFANFILGHFGLLYSWLYWVILIILLPKTFSHIYSFGSRLRDKIPDLTSIKRSKFELGLIIILLIHIFMAVTLSMVPDRGEGSAVHLAMASYYRMHHGIVHIPFMFYGEQPHLTEMIWLSCIMLLKSSVLCKLMNFTAYLLVLGTIYAISRRILSRKYALLGCAIFSITTEIIFVYFHTCKEEFFLTFFTLLSFLVLLSYFKERKIGYLFLLTIILGYATGCKLLFGFIPSLAIIPLLLSREIVAHKKHRWKVISSCILISVSVIILAFPWYMRQQIYHHSLFYPLKPIKTVTTGDRSSVGFIEEDQEAFTVKSDQLVFRHTIPFRGSRGDKVKGIVKGYFLFLWRMVNEPKSFGGTSASILFLILLPGLLFLKHPLPNEYKYLLLFGLLLYTLNFLCPAMIQRFFPLMAVLSMICAYIYYNLSKASRAINLFLLLIVGTILITLTITKNINHKVISGFKSYWPVAFGAETRKEHLERTTYGTCSTANFISENLTKDAKLFFYALAQGFYYENDYIWGDKLHAGEFMQYSRMNCAEDLLRRLHSLGITHLVISAGYWPPRKGYNEENIHAWVKQIAAQYSTKLFEDKYISLYEIDYSKKVGAGE